MRGDPLHMPVPDRKAGFPSALDLLLLLFMVNLTVQPLVEPDFGWHLRAGLDFLDRGGHLPEHDPYSHTMPDWPWIEHAWLTDVVIALIYREFGSAGALSVMLWFGAVAIAAFVIGAARAESSRTSRLAAIVVSLWVALPYLGARTQLVSLVGIALVLWLYHHVAQRGPWFVWLYPPLFLVWANLHGGFTAGLVFLGLILATSTALRIAAVQWPLLRHLYEPLLTGKQLILLTVSVGLSGAVTLVNPYGWRLHREIYESLSDRFMLEHLREWQPVSFDGWAGTALLLYMVIVAGFSALWYRRIEPVRWVLLAASLGWAMWHSRNVTIFLVVTVPLVAEVFEAGAIRMRQLVPYRGRAMAVATLTLITGLVLISLDGDHLERIVSAGIDPERFFERTEYPIEAVSWIKGHPHELGSRLYNDYGYGGFLLWWMPEQKVFIDGRMPAWRIDDRTILYDYLIINGGGPPALRLLEKYGIDWGLIQRNSPLAAALSADSGWRELYSDAKVVIVRRSL
jgi:hypothetical protein